MGMVRYGGGGSGRETVMECGGGCGMGGCVVVEV